MKNLSFLIILLLTSLSFGAGPYYVDIVTGNDQDIAVSGDGAYTHASKTIVKVGAFANSEIGYLIDITGGTNITPGLYQIATNADNDTITLMTAPGTGDQTDISIDDSDGLSAGECFATLCRAADMINDGETCFVKSGTYSTQDGAEDSVWEMDDPGVAGSPMHWIACSSLSDVNDGGVVKVDAGVGGYANAAECDVGVDDAMYQVFYGFYFTGATSVGFAGGAADNLIFYNCRFGGNGSDGFDGDNACWFMGCLVDENAGIGIDADSGTKIETTFVYFNTGIGFNLADGTVNKCIASENLGDQIAIGTIGEVHHCVLDGNDVANSDGIFWDSDTAVAVISTNNIFYDCAYGQNADADAGYFSMSLNNMYYSCDTDNTNNFISPTDAYAYLRGDFVAASDPFAITGAIADLDAALDRYILHTTNTPAVGGKGGGRDVSVTADFWAYYIATTNPPDNAEIPRSEIDIGAQQLVDSAGGNPRHGSKRGGKQ